MSFFFIIKIRIFQENNSIWTIFRTFIDYCALHHLESEDLRAHFRMAMFYFELVYDEIEESSKTTNKLEISDNFVRRKDYITFYTGFMLAFDEYTVMIVRLHWLNYCIQKFNKNFPDALNFLYKVSIFQDIISKVTISYNILHKKNSAKTDRGSFRAFRQQGHHNHPKKHQKQRFY